MHFKTKPLSCTNRNVSIDLLLYISCKSRSKRLMDVKRQIEPGKIMYAIK